ncbi:hypothetical protein EDB86DRAFT_2087340 [Lactarius hatsudake]|nr:hypothetical protein EDB86DRAFT_2087340 [Lactarius hatsudake]
MNNLSHEPLPRTLLKAAPLLFGPLFNWALYGVLCIQIYVYNYNFPCDGRAHKDSSLLRLRAGHRLDRADWG